MSTKEPAVKFRQRKKKKKKQKQNQEKSLLSFGNADAEKSEEKRKKKPRKTLLSFDEEDSVEPEFKVDKNKNASDDVQRAQKRAQRRAHEREMRRQGPSKLTSYGMSSAGEYTAERLHALKSNAVHLQTSARNERGGARDERGDRRPKDPVPIAAEDEGDSKQPLAGQPDQHHILKAKKRRETMRALGGKSGKLPDYISLTGSDKKQYGPADSVSALVTDDVDDDVPEYHETTESTRLKFGDPGKENKSRYAAEVQELDDDMHKEETQSDGSEDDEVDEDMLRWEEDLIRKGGGAGLVKRHKAEEKQKLKPSYRAKHAQTWASANASPLTAIEDKPDRPTPTFDMIQNRLRQRLERLSTVQNKRQTALATADAELVKASNQIAALQEGMNEANKQFVFYQETEDSIADSLDCLGEKAPMLEGAAEELSQMKQKRRQSRVDNQRRHATDLVLQAYGEQWLTKRRNHLEAMDQDRSSAEQTELDEFGRDAHAADEHGREQRRQWRAERTTKRRQMRTFVATEEEAGWSTEEDMNEAKHEEDRGELLQDAGEIFSDVKDELTTHHHTSATLSRWKQRYPEAYSQAYIGLCVPGLLIPWIRLQSLAWRPLQNPSLDSFKWYRELLSFGGDAALQDDDDPDNKLVPKLVEKVLAPMVEDMVLYEWDCYSQRHCKPFLTAVSEIITHLDEKHKVALALQETIIQRMTGEAHAHSGLPVVPWLRPVPPTGDVEARKQFCLQRAWCLRRWWRSLKLFRIICKCNFVLDSETVWALGVSQLKDSIFPFLAQSFSDPTARGEADVDGRGQLRHMCRRLAEELSSGLPHTDPKAKALDQHHKGVISQLQSLLSQFLASPMDFNHRFVCVTGINAFVD